MTVKFERGPSTAATVVPVKPNLLRNSGFWFAQCQAPGTLTNMSNTANRRMYGPDGWYGVYEATFLQYARVDTDAAPETGLAGRYYGRFVKTTSAGKVMICQAIESTHGHPTRGKQIRIQMLLKASAASTWRIGLLQLTSTGTADTINPAPADSGSVTSAWNGTGTDPTLTAANNIAYIAPDASNADNATVSGNGLSCSVTTSWQRFGGTFTIPTDCHNLIVVIWSNAQMAASDEINVAEASMTLGTDTVLWAPLPYELELQRCQRYIVKSFAIDTAPVQAAGITNSLQGITGKSGTSNDALYIFWQFPVPLWKSGLTNVFGFPLRGITYYNPNSASVLAYNYTAAINMGSPLSTIAGQRQVTYQAPGIGGGGGSGVGDRCALHLLIFGEL